MECLATGMAANTKGRQKKQATFQFFFIRFRTLLNYLDQKIKTALLEWLGGVCRSLTRKCPWQQTRKDNQTTANFFIYSHGDGFLEALHQSVAFIDQDIHGSLQDFPRRHSTHALHVNCGLKETAILNFAT